MKLMIEAKEHHVTIVNMEGLKRRESSRKLVDNAVQR